MAGTNGRLFSVLVGSPAVRGAVNNQRKQLGAVPVMICPHCNQTIAEQDRYLMSRDPDAAWPSWGKYGVYLILFAVLVGLIHLASTHL
jgi:hypothetical protein